MRTMAGPTGKKGREEPKSKRAWVSGWIGKIPVAIAASAVVACSGSIDEESIHQESLGTASQAVYAGTTDNDEAKNEAVVALKIGDNAGQFELCSGSLIAPNLVLTARHCVSANITPTVACDENGNSGNGDHVGADQAAESIHVFVGATPNFRSGTPAANGVRIFHGKPNILCDNDIAIVLLDRSINDVAPMKMRLRSKTLPGETVRAVGYGQNDKNLPVGTRLRKDNVAVLAVGSSVSPSETPLATSEMEVGLSICQGDSGGPAISETTGAVIGIVSRGGSCSDDFGHIYTLTTGFDSLFAEAFEAAGGAPLDEGPIASRHVSPGNELVGADPAIQLGRSGSGSETASNAASQPSRAPANLRAGSHDVACSVHAAGAGARGEAGAWLGIGLAMLAIARGRKRQTP